MASVRDALELTLQALEQLGDIHADGHVAGLVRGSDVRAGRITVTSNTEPLDTADLVYASPERCGALDSLVDARSDLYSMGVVLYELLTAGPPFTGSDSAALVHAHLTKQPPPPDHGIPAGVADAVMRLLAKDPDRRYQSADGLAADLALLSHALDTGPLEDFEPGRFDRPAPLRHPTRLHGVTETAAALHDVLRLVRTGAGSQLAIVTGPSGSGKTAVVASMADDVIASGGVAVSAKADPDRAGVPYGPVSEAVDGLAQWALGLPSQELDRLKARLASMGPSLGAVLTEIVPTARHLVGADVSAPPPPDPAAAVRAAVSHLVAAVAEISRPVMIFCDDVQWADAAAVPLIRAIMADCASSSVLFVVAHRIDDESTQPPADGTDPAAFLSGIDDDPAVTTIRTAPLDRDAARSLVSDILGDRADIPEGLLDHVLSASRGNPFDIWQHVVSLHNSGLLSASRDENAQWRWVWQGRGGTAGASIESHVGSYEMPTRDMLGVAALAGTAVDLDIVATAAGTSRAHARALLTPPRRDGILIDTARGLRFCHDRVRDAAMRLLDEPQRAATHRRLAYAMEAAGGSGGSRIFEIVAQIDEAQRLVSDQDVDQATAACRLQLLASQRATRTGAYGAAADYAYRGLAAMPSDLWDSDPDLAYALAYAHTGAAITAGRFAEADGTFSELVERAESEVDRWQIRALALESAMGQLRFEDAIALVLEALQACGAHIGIPPTPSERADLVEEARLAIAGLGPDQLRSRECPPEVAARIAFLATALPMSYSVGPDLHTAIGAVITRECARNGAAPGCGPGIAALAADLVEVDAEEANRLGSLAVETAERFGGEAFVRFLVARFVTYWTRGPTETIRQLRRVAAVAARNADVAMRHFAHHDISTLHVITDTPLARAHEEAVENVEYWQGAVVPLLQWPVQSGLAWVRTLQGRTDPADPLAELAGYAEGAVTLVYRFYLATRLAFAAYMRELTAETETALQTAREFVEFGRLEPTASEFVFIDALAHAGEADGAEPEERLRLVEEIRASADRLGSLRSRCRDAFVVEHEAVLAELARLDGDHPRAAEHYEAALDAAALTSALPHRIIVLRLMRNWMSQRGRVANEAIYADAATRLDAHWKGLPTADASAPLDATTLLEMVRSVSSSLSVDEISAGVAEVLMRRLGADRVVVAVSDAGELALAVEAIVEGDTIVTRTDNAGQIPWPVLRRAFRTGEAVRSDDPEPARAVPLRRGVRSVGVLYIAHRSFPDTFSAALDAALDVLATQLAISLDNARLVDDLSRAEARYRQVFSGAPLGIAAVSASDGTILNTNPALNDLIGGGESVHGRALVDFVHPDDTDVLARIMAVQEPTHALRLRTATGTTAHVVLHAAAADVDAAPVVVIHVEDVTQLRRAEAELAHRSRHDNLTGLLNRTGLEASIEAAITASNDVGRPALVLVGVDRFRVLNESLGHVAGDRVLTALSQRLQEASLPDEVAARLDSDVFAVLTSAPGHDAAAARARSLLAAVFSRPVPLQAGTGGDDLEETFVTGSAGYAVADPEDTPADLMRHGDAALYQAKSRGRGTVGGFQDTMRRSTRHRLALEQALFRALERRELFTRWQPQVSTNTGRITACEALLGWHRPDGTELPAGAFVPSAEELGLISDFGFWILDDALEQLWHWDQAGLAVDVGVNISGRQLHEPDLVERVVAALGSTDPTRLVLEVTETVVAVDADENIEVLRRLHDIGVRIAIDDFGTGYSSLSYLHHLPVDVLKIDRSFVTPLGTAETAAEALVSTTITLAHTLGLEVVAEGVETELQRDILVGLGCDTVQGYLYARPSRAELITPYLQAANTQE